MIKSYLLMVKVNEEKGRVKIKDAIRVTLIDEKPGESIWIHPSRLINPEDLDYRPPAKGEIYFDNDTKNWEEATADFPVSRLILRKPKDKWQDWTDRCPFSGYTLEAKKAMAAWVREAIDIKEGDS